MARRELLAVAFYSLLANNRSGLFLVFFPLFLIQRGAPAATALALVSLGYVGSSLTGPVAGRWSDRLGRRRPFLIVGEVGALPLFAAIPFLSDYLADGVLFIAAQTVLSLGQPAMNALVADVSRETERGAGFGLLNSAGSYGAIVGFVAAGLLSLRFELNSIFLVVVAVMVGTVAVAIGIVPDLRVQPTPQRATWREYRPLLAFAVVVSIRSLGMGAVGTYYGTYAAQLGATVLDIAAI